MANGVVQTAAFKSEKGQPASVQNPWPGKSLVVSQVGGGTVTTTRNAGVYSFPTTAGASYALTPLGGIPTAAPTSLSIYKNVSATSSIEQGGWSANAVVDGTESSVAGSMGWSSQNSLGANHTEAITVDLRSNFVLSGIALTPRTDSPNAGYGFPIDFTIQLSADNVNWRTVVSRTGYALPPGTPQNFVLGAQAAQFVKITGTNLRANPSDLNQYRMQFAEIAAQPVVSLAAGATVTASSSVEASGWGAAKAVDGNTDSTSAGMGWTSASNLGSNHSEWIMLDMGTNKTFSWVALYPRNDGANAGYGFPIDFTVESAASSVGPWTSAFSQSGVANPGAAPQAYNFSARAARYLRITGTNLRQNPNDSNQYRMQFAEIMVGN